MILVKKSAFEKALFKEIKELKDKTDNIKSGLMLQKYDSLTTSSVQGLMYDKTCRKISKSIIKPIILEACIRSEMSAAGSGDLCLDLILGTLPDIIRRQKKHNFDLEDVLKEFINNILRKK